MRSKLPEAPLWASGIGFGVTVPGCFLLASIVLAAPAVACVTVEGDSISAGELAQASPAFAALDPGLTVASAPLAGAVRALRAAELSSFLQHKGISLPERIDDICVERAWEPLTAALLTPVLADHLSGGAPEIAEYSRVRIPVSAGRKFEITSAGGGAGAKMIRGRVTYAGGHSVAFWVRLKGLDGVAPLGSQPDSIQRGETVSVEVHSGAARLAFESTAESSGHPGESVLVRNPQNGKLFQARVQCKGKVVIER